MSGPKHTPGPWGLNRLVASGQLIVVARHNHAVAFVAKHAHISPDEHFANGTLLASAPRLAEALKRLLTLAEAYHEHKVLSAAAPRENDLVAIIEARIIEARAALREAGVEQ